MSAALGVWKQELKPLLAIVNKNNIAEQGKEPAAIETHFFNTKKKNKYHNKALFSMVAKSQAKKWQFVIRFFELSAFQML